MPADTYQHTTSVSAPPEAVWDALQHADAWAGIGPIDDVWDSEHDPDGTLAGYRWSANAAGRSWKGTARRTDASRPARMSLKLETDEMRGTITTDLVSGPAGTELTVTLRAEATGMLATLFWGVISSAIGRGFSRQVEAFGGRFSAEG
jgi:carbon monoxide dehydrogenase subunit G